MQIFAKTLTGTTVTLQFQIKIVCFHYIYRCRFGKTFFFGFIFGEIVFNDIEPKKGEKEKQSKDERPVYKGVWLDYLLHEMDN